MLTQPVTREPQALFRGTPVDQRPGASQLAQQPGDPDACGRQSGCLGLGVLQLMAPGTHARMRCMHAPCCLAHACECILACLKRMHAKWCDANRAWDQAHRAVLLGYMQLSLVSTGAFEGG